MRLSVSAMAVTIPIFSSVGPQQLVALAAIGMWIHHERANILPYADLSAPLSLMHKNMQTEEMYVDHSFYFIAFCVFLSQFLNVHSPKSMFRLPDLGHHRESEAQKNRSEVSRDEKLSFFL